jgi:DNA primase
LGYFSCNQCHERWGDAIEYLRWMRGVTFREAAQALGGDVSNLAPLAPTPAPPKPADELPPSGDWQTAMTAFVDACAATLPGSVRDYLHKRGLDDETIQHRKIGYHAAGGKAGAHIAGRWWAWRGITIPTFYAGALWCVNVRRRKDDEKRDDFGKYVKTKGSKAAFFNGDALTNAKGILLCAGEFDALIAQKHAPPGMACVTLGGENKNPSLRWQIALHGLPLFVCFDNDPAGEKNAPKWGGQVVRVPSGKDITEFWQSGGDVAGWLRELVASEDGAEFHALILESLERLGYEPYYADNGHIVAAMPQEQSS